MFYDHGHKRAWAVRTEFGALVDELDGLSAKRDPLLCLAKLGQMRIEARRCHLSALVAVTEKCEEALHRAIRDGRAGSFDRDYIQLMREAIDYGDVSPDACEALLASAAYRMTG